MSDIRIGDIVQPLYDLFIYNDFDCEAGSEDIGTVVGVSDLFDNWWVVDFADNKGVDVPGEALDVIKKYEPPINDPTKYERGLFD